jgi:hypothetical protein
MDYEVTKSSRTHRPPVGLDVMRVKSAAVELFHDRFRDADMGGRRSDAMTKVSGVRQTHKSSTTS